MSNKLSRILILLLFSNSANVFAQDKKPADTAHKELQLKEASVIAQKQSIETAPGKTIINVQALAGNAGKNVLELLRRLPGVNVDGNGNISMTGKQGVLVLINGRQTYLSGDELRSYLEGMSAEELTQVELITQPSAHYDAEGNSGIINLKTRKSGKQGFNGSTTTTYTQSTYGVEHTTILLNYRKNKTNWFTTVTHINGRNGINWDEAIHYKDSAGNTTATTHISSKPVEIYDKYNIRIGADCNLSEKTNIGFSATGSYYGNAMRSYINTENDALNSTPVNTMRTTTESSLRRNATGNAYLKHNFSKASELNLNLDYLLYTKRLYQYITTTADSGGTALPDQLMLRSRVPINIALYSATADHNYTFGNGLKIESGAKHSFVTVDNAAYFRQYTAGDWTDDPSRTNRFIYSEHISALYVNGTKKLNAKWDAQLGLRGELANIYGLQQATGEQFGRHLPAIFPTAYLSYKADSANTLELNYGRRIERPQYGMLNPFNYYTFYSTYQRGNPDLLPQYAHNVELKHNYKNHLATSLELSIVNDVMTYVSIADNIKHTTYGMPVNFQSNKTANLSITYNNKIRSWWELGINASGKYGNYTGLLNNVPVAHNGGGYYAWMSSQFTFGKWAADCYVNYVSRMAISQIGTAEHSIYSECGISRKLWNDSLIVKMNVSDPFYVFTTKNSETQPYLFTTSEFRNSSPFYTLSVTYNFGKSAGKSTEHNNKAPEEEKRM